MTERNRVARPRAAMARTRHQRLTTAREAAQGTATCTDGGDGQRARVIVLPAPPPLDISEAHWQRLVTDLATVCAWQWYHTHDSRRSPAGLPDLILVRERVLWVELKRERGRLRPEQREWGLALMRARQDWRCWKPSDWDEVVATLTAEE